MGQYEYLHAGAEGEPLGSVGAVRPPLALDDRYVPRGYRYEPASH